ncbi:MAG TPA: S-layer homology domain-containing protein [Clostridiales bacterium]|nr:S-layer homology domain-containing protein [Clostridiales bacterium]
MKISRGILTAALTLVFCFLCSSSVMAASFPDISDHWAERYIEEAVSEGLFYGYSDGTFKPDGYITRAEMATVYVRVMQLQNAVPNYFTDMSGAWYDEAVLKNVYAGILSGYPDQTFRPNNKITRQEAAKMMGNCLPDNATGAGISGFSDHNLIADWAAEDVALCANKGYFVGDQCQRFNPSGNLTRAEAATILVRMSNSETIIPGTAIGDTLSSGMQASAATTTLSNQIRPNGLNTGNNASLNLNGVSLLGQSTLNGSIGLSATRVVRMDISGEIVMSHTTVGSANISGIVQCSNSSFGAMVVNGTSSFDLQNSSIGSMEVNAPTTVGGSGSSIQTVQQNVNDFTSSVPINQTTTEIPATKDVVTVKVVYNGGSEKTVTFAYGANDTLFGFLYTVACDPKNASLLNSELITPFNNNLAEFKTLKVNGVILWSNDGWNEAIDLFDGTSASSTQLNRMKPNFSATNISLSDFQNFIGGLNMLYAGELSSAERSRLVSNLNAMDLTTTTTSGATVSFTLSCKAGTLTNQRDIGAYFINNILWTGDTVDQFFAKCGEDNTVTLRMDSTSGKSAQVTIQKKTI